ncbi:glycosyltransferase [Streptomyces sp. NPDC001137]|uniref:glycosyltransferase n=1 Tax=Streptomyces sp. NPDC001137 TaxID=3154378 RepID=UPI003326A99D
MAKRAVLMSGRAASLTSAVARWPAVATGVRRGRQRPTARQWSARLALPTAVVLWLLSLRHVDLRAMHDFGLLQVLPVLFWGALGLLALGFCLSMADRRTGSGWFTGYVLALIAFLHATPTLLYPTLRYGWAWKHVAVVDAVIRNGGHVPNADKLTIYNQWPGFFELNAFFLKATGLESSLAYAAWAPPFFNALLLGPLLLLYRSVTRDRRLVWGAAWIFYSCSWVGQDYFAPQAFAFLLFVTLIALVLGQLPSAPRRSDSAPTGWPAGRLVLVLVLAAVIVTSHPLTPLMLISALVALSIPGRNRRVVLPVLAGAVLFTAIWDATIARTYIAANLNSFVAALVQPDANVVSGLAALGTAAPGQVLVSWVDRALSAAVFLLAAIAFVRRRWVRRTGLPLLVVAPLPLLAANAYGGEMIFRAYLFALPAAAFLIAALVFQWGRRPRLRAVISYPLLLAMLGGLVFGYYGKEASAYFTKDEVNAVHFVTAIAPPGSLIVSLTSAAPGLFMHYDEHPRVELDQQELSARRQLIRDPMAGLEPFVQGATGRNPAYIILNRAQAAETYLNGTLPADTMPRLQAAMARTPGFVAVYRNRDAVVYEYQNPTKRGG